MDSQPLPIVPFGKYKGQPITNLLNDTNTLEWYKQNGILQKYPIIYNICVNQTITTNNPDSKTPEHNRLQNMFLQDENVIKLLRKIIYNKTGDIPKKTHYDFNCEFESIFNWDILINDIYIYKCRSDEDYLCEDCFDYDIKGINDICVEIKPMLGDDYPCVLRKMKTQKELTRNEYYINIKELEPGEYPTIYCPSNYVLLIKDFNSTTTTKEQLITIFNQSGIKVVFTDDLFNHNNPQVNTTIEQIERPIMVSLQEQEQEIIQTEENNSFRDNLLETQQKLLEEQEKNRQLEEKISQLEEEIQLLKKKKQVVDIRDFFGKK
jgi:hypothetical protein